MRLTHVVTASDLNPRYLACWEPMARAWQTIGGLEPILVLVAREEDIPAALRADARVRIFEPLPELHTALQAQCIRLLYPALLDTDGGGVVTSDVDMVPLNRRYFHGIAGRVDERHFLAFRDVLLEGMEIPICYNAALPSTWSDVFGVAGVEDVRARLREWARGIDYAGVRGKAGWDTDQQVLYRILVERARTKRDVWILDDRYSGYHRLLQHLIGVDGVQGVVRRGVARGHYSDFHLVHPYEAERELNESIIELAVGAV
jgi:hypothetical protein